METLIMHFNLVSYGIKETFCLQDSSLLLNSQVQPTVVHLVQPILHAIKHVTNYLAEYNSYAVGSC